MYSSDQIKEVHLEITQRCQAACPMCDRNQNGGDDNPHLTNAELSLEDCKKIFPVDFVQQLERMFMCGNYGDPIVARESLAVFRWFRELNPTMWLSMNTNAGAQEPEWWSELAEILGDYGAVTFSVDGLADTNHIYRQNVRWDRVERSMRAFTAAGGRARWDYLVFAHNEHQVEQAREFADQLGFEQFNVKRSARIQTVNRIGTSRKGEQRVFTVPQTERYQNPVIEQDTQATPQGVFHPPKLLDPTHEKVKRLNTVNIDCKVKRSKSVYVSAEGHVLPCCWVAGKMYNRWWDQNPQTTQVWRYIKLTGGADSIDARTNGIRHVLDTHKLYSSIQRSWGLPTVGLGKLDVCCQKCPAGNDAFSAQWENNEST